MTDDVESIETDETELTEVPDHPHGFLGWTREAKAARDMLALIGRRLREHLQVNPAPAEPKDDEGGRDHGGYEYFRNDDATGTGRMSEDLA